MVSTSRSLTRTGWILSVVALLLMVLSASAFAEKITIMTRGIQTTLEGDPLGKAIDLFTKKTGIEVEVVPFTGWDDLRQKLPTMVAGGISPDAVYHDNGAQADLYFNGSVQPIEKFVARDNLDLGIWPSALMDAYRYDGQLYSLPTGVSSWVMFYNTDKMYAAGLPDLPAEWNTPDWNFDKLTSISKKLTKDQDGDGTPDQYGIDDIFSRGAQAIHLWGLDWVNEDQTEFVGNSGEHVAVINRIKEMYKDLRVVGGNWMSGEAVMMAKQAYYLNTIAKAMEGGGFFGWKVAALPSEKCPCAPTGFHSWGIPYGAKNAEGGWKWVKFITTDPEAATLFARAENRVPVTQAAQEDFIRRWESVNPGMRAEVYAKGLQWVLNPNWAGLPRTFWTNLYNKVSEITYEGTTDPKVGLDELKPVMDGILKEVKEQKASM